MLYTGSTWWVGIIIVVMGFIAACVFMFLIYCEHGENAVKNTFRSLQINDWLGQQFDNVIGVFRPLEVHDSYVGQHPHFPTFKDTLRSFQPKNLCADCARKRTFLSGILFPWTSRANAENIDGSQENFNENDTCQGHDCKNPNKPLSDVNERYVDVRSATYMGCTVLKMSRTPQPTNFMYWASFAVCLFVLMFGMKLICIAN